MQQLEALLKEHKAANDRLQREVDAFAADAAHMDSNTRQELEAELQRARQGQSDAETGTPPPPISTKATTDGRGIAQR